MKNSGDKLSDQTLETMVRSFFSESSKYGFSQLDYVRFVNMLLDLSMEQVTSESKSASESQSIETSDDEVQILDFPIESKRIRIRKFDPDTDIEVMKKWLSDKSGRQFLLSRVTAQAIDLERIVNDDWNILGMITTHDGVPVGCVAYLGFNSEQRKAELRKIIGEPSMRGMGLAKEATKIWIRYGVTVLKLKKIHLSTLDTDIRNIRLNEALGFKVEGILRNEIYVEGVYHDVLRMGLWNE